MIGVCFTSKCCLILITKIFESILKVSNLLNLAPAVFCAKI